MVAANRHENRLSEELVGACLELIPKEYWGVDTLVRISSTNESYPEFILQHTGIPTLIKQIGIADKKLSGCVLELFYELIINAKSILLT